MASANELRELSEDELLRRRYAKFRKIGKFTVDTPDGKPLPLPADPHTATPESYTLELERSMGEHSKRGGEHSESGGGDSEEEVESQSHPTHHHDNKGPVPVSISVKK